LGTVVNGAVQRPPLDKDPADFIAPPDDKEDVPIEPESPGAITPQDVESDVNDDGVEAHKRRLARERKLKAPDHASIKMERLKNIKQHHRVKLVKQQK
jgi:hypothetical protein